MKTITIFGSSHPQPGEKAYEDAFSVGAALAGSGFSICNGGYGGTMEAGAKGARSAHGRTIGVTCTLFVRSPNEWNDETVLTQSLEERLMTLVARGDGFVVLPGGTGTLLELAYILEAMNKEFIDRRPIVLYGDFWTPVLEPLKKEMKEEGLGKIGEVLHVVSTTADLVKKLQ